MTNTQITQADIALAQKFWNLFPSKLITVDWYAEQIAAHRLAHIPQSVEPVAVIGKDWQLLWASPEPLSKTVARTGIKIGSPLYAEPNIERMRAVLQAIEKEGMRNHATRCAPWWNDVRAIIREQKP